MIEQIDKSKLCWNCEGSVTRSTSNCPYCGVYLHPEEEAVEERTLSKTPEPPYQVDETEQEEVIPQAPYTPQQREAVSVAPSIQEDWKAVVIPMVLLMSGSMFLLFSVMMFLFSHHGYLTIRWDASYWFYYLLASVPLLYFGWRVIDKTEE